MDIKYPISVNQEYSSKRSKENNAILESAELYKRLENDIADQFVGKIFLQDNTVNGIELIRPIDPSAFIGLVYLRFKLNGKEFTFKKEIKMDGYKGGVILAEYFADEITKAVLSEVALSLKEYGF